MLRKLIIVPWFGQYPSWLDKWKANTERLDGYDFKVFSNLDLFKERVRRILGIEPRILSGTGKAWDFRPMFGELFSDEIKGYDYWGHTDFDVVYGDVNSFITDELLGECDIFTLDDEAICGPWTLYRNQPHINSFYKKIPNWKELLETEKVFGLEEKAFSSVVSCSILRICSAPTLQGYDDFAKYTVVGNKLYMNGQEILLRHFRHTKQWPIES